MTKEEKTNATKNWEKKLFGVPLFSLGACCAYVFSALLIFEFTLNYILFWISHYSMCV